MENEKIALTAHLYRRAGFGATRGELERQAERPYEDVVEDLLHPERFPEVEDDLLRRYHGPLVNFDSLSWNGAKWIYRMVNTERPLQEKMALFWHHIFATAYHKGEHTATLIAQNNMFRSNGLSNFRTILLDLSHDPAMIFWLDNNENHNGDPNENYGRELMELFSMGIGNYTEHDIKMAARGFYRLDVPAAHASLPVRPLPVTVRLSRRRPRPQRQDLPRPHRRLQWRGHHQPHRPTARHGPVPFETPLQLLRRRRGAGPRVEHRPAPEPRRHRHPGRGLHQVRRRHACHPPRPLQLRFLQECPLPKGQESGGA